MHAVDGISLQVDEGELFTLLGPSGCGKTTTLRCIAGLEMPDDGVITVAGRTLFSRGTAHVACRRTSAASAWSSSRTRSGRT